MEFLEAPVPCGAGASCFVCGSSHRALLGRLLAMTGGRDSWAA